MLRPEHSTSVRLHHKMSPQLLQSLRLLQMSAVDLELEVKQQLELNPLLEEVVELREEGEEELLEREEEGLKAEEELPADMEEVDWDALLGDQYDAGAYNSERTEYDPNWEADRPENRIAAVPPLYDHLHRQLGEYGDLEPEERAIAEYIIGNIDERGYVGCELEVIADDLAVEVEAVEQMLRVIQTFEPPGVGARDLRECLLIQLSQRDDRLSQLALQVMRDHLDNLTGRRLRRITRALKISAEQLKEVLRVLACLEPHPALAMVGADRRLLTLNTEVSYIAPDLVIEQVGEEWIASLADEYVPAVRINAEYQYLLNSSGANNKDGVQDYVAKNLNDARWLISAINQRRITMLKVANYLLEAQLPFFEQGPSRLRPLVLQDVADAVEMHVSTISRVSKDKYVQTPHGVFELKYFFDNRVSTDEGQDVSVRSVKEKISQLVTAEDKARPLSDQQIAEELNKDGLRIARRTIAKYRDQLKIPARRYRKKLEL